MLAYIVERRTCTTHTWQCNLYCVLAQEPEWDAKKQQTNGFHIFFSKSHS